MHLSITYYTRLRVTEAKIDNVIEVSDSHYLGLKYEDQFNNNYDFLKKCFIALKILELGKSVFLSLALVFTYPTKTICLFGFVFFILYKFKIQQVKLGI